LPAGGASVKTNKTKKHAKKEHEAKKQMELLVLLVQLEGIQVDAPVPFLTSLAVKLETT